MEENLKKLSEALYAYIQFPWLEKLEKEPMSEGAISVNLSWMKKVNKIEMPLGEPERNLVTHMRFIKKELIELIKKYWESFERIQGVKNHEENEITFIYTELMARHDNGKKIIFGLRRNNRDLELTKILDELKPNDYDYGFNLPFIICGI